MYYIAITGYGNPIITKIPFEINVFNNKPALLLADNYNIEDAVIDIEHETFEENHKMHHPWFLHTRSNKQQPPRRNGNVSTKSHTYFLRMGIEWCHSCGGNR